MRTENLAIMFTDMSGFTERTSSQTRGENALMLELHEALLLPVLRAFNGKRVKSIGDAFLVTFRSPTDAVLCGMAIQDRLHEYNRDVPAKLRIEVRVAVNLGEVRIVRGDVFGEPVNIASRVEGMTPPGEIYLTESVHLAMNKREVPSLSVGPQELKGIPEKIGVYKVPRLVAGEAAGDYPFGGRELAHVKDSGAKLHLARDLALSIGGTLERGGDSLVMASSSIRGWMWNLRQLAAHGFSSTSGALRSVPRRYLSLENRAGRWRVRGSVLALALVIGAASAWIYQAAHFDPYKETRALVRQGAYPTALARLDALARNKSYLAQGEYWFWRGRAQLGRGAADNAIEAYKEAIAHDSRFRSDTQLVADATELTARRHSARAQKLILTELGPNAVSALLTEMVDSRAASRWMAVDAAEQLGARERIPYAAVALADFNSDTSCAKRKLALPKLAEYGVHDALPALQAMRDQPEYKCLQPVLATTLERLSH